jgi:hypothetical protein
VLRTLVAVMAAGLGLAIAGPSTGVQQKSSSLPPQLERYVSTVVKLTPEERARLMSGGPVTRMLDVDQSKEVAVFAAIWINAPIRRYVEAVKDIETFERGGGFKITKRISTPPRLEDFAAMRLTDEDMKDLRDCRVGDCEFKLAESAMQRMRAEVNFNAPNARAVASGLMQRLALDYVTSYLAGGNEQLAVYRDKSRPTFVAQEFRAMTEQMPELTAFMPNLRRYLLEFPRVTVPDVTSFLYWQETEFGLKPTIRISHLTIRESADDAVVASKMLYASHYFWTGLELRVLVADPARGPGFWFATVNRSRSDGLSGFTGMIVRRKVQGEVEEGARRGLQSTKQMLERAR